MIDSLATWQTTFQSLPVVSDTSWRANIAAWVAGRVVDAELTDITDASPPSFLFAESTFETALASLTITTSQSSAATAFAAAWATAITASTLDFASGTTIGTPSPSTTFSVINSQVIDAASISAAQSAMITALNGAAKVDDAADSELPTIIRDAFLALTGTLSGLDSAGVPQPLIAANVPFI